MGEESGLRNYDAASFSAGLKFREFPVAEIPPDRRDAHSYALREFFHRQKWPIGLRIHAKLAARFRKVKRRYESGRMTTQYQGKVLGDALPILRIRESESTNYATLQTRDRVWAAP